MNQTIWTKWEQIQESYANSRAVRFQEKAAQLEEIKKQISAQLEQIAQHKNQIQQIKVR